MIPPLALEEYKSLRSEIELHYKSTLTIQPLVFAGLGGIFVLQQYNKLAVWGVPVVILAAGLASIPHYMRMMAIGRYLYSVEKRYMDEGEGWEHFLRGKNAHLPRIASVPFFVFTTSAWLVLGFFAVVLAVLAI